MGGPTLSVWIVLWPIPSDSGVSLLAGVPTERRPPSLELVLGDVSASVGASQRFERAVSGVADWATPVPVD
jgi:hypothetical protein